MQTDFGRKFLHTIAFEQSGNPNGEPVLVIHMSGEGVSHQYRQHFRPNFFYHIIQFDQRDVENQHPMQNFWKIIPISVSDIEKILGNIWVSKMEGFEGLWGSTLSLIYAIHYPQRVSELMLRGIFMCRKSELKWFYQDGASHIFADAFSL